MVELDGTTFEKFLAYGKRFVHRTDLEPGAFAAIGYLVSRSTISLDDIADMRWEGLAETLKDAEVTVHRAQEELQLSDWFSAFSIYHAFAVVFAERVVDIITKSTGLSGQNDFEASIQKIVDGLSSTSKYLQAIEYSSAQAQNTFLPERKDGIINTLSLLENAVLEEFGPNEETGELRTFGEPFLPNSLSRRFSRLAKKIQLISDEMPRLDSKRTQDNSTHLFLQCLAQLWANVKKKPASAEGNNKLDSYTPPFVRFVHAAWDPDVMGMATPSISTVRRHLNSSK